MSESAPALDPPAASEATPRRTDPLTFLVKAAAVLPQMLIPLGFVAFGTFDDGLASELAWVGLLVLAALGLILASAWMQWSRFTYRVGPADIRVESGVLARSARSVPYERIQDVSLEQKLLPRLLGLVAVKFETGAGGKDELSLAYLTQGEGEALRELVRERRDEAVESVAADSADETSSAASEPATTLFAMDARRLATFGLFEFSLAIFAVLGGAAQYAEMVLGIEVWDPDLWSGWLAGPSGWFAELGMTARVLSALAGLVVLLFIGSATGLIRTVLRDWGFRLERTAKGFRRRRGLLTRTDVVMPAHRVQAARISTGLVRRRFGWQALAFISLAQDAGSANHVVAPFAREEEIEPIIRSARFAPPPRDIDWHRRCRRHRDVAMGSVGAIFGPLTLAILGAIGWSGSEALAERWWMPLIPGTIGVLLLAREYLQWRFARNAIDAGQLYRRSGWLAPTVLIGSRVKLQSAEIRQGPLARLLGYADLHLGLAGGRFAVTGIPLERARTLRNAVLESIEATDFSRLAR